MQLPSALVFALVLSCGPRGTSAGCEVEEPDAAALGGGNSTLVCDEGCYDIEDEACHEGLTPNQCAEIYGHVLWGPLCRCRREDGTLISSAVAGPKEQEVNLYFSIPAFVVLFRESLEVVLILAIILQFLTKAKDDGSISEEAFRRFRREVYVGATAGFILCLVFGMGFLALASLARGLFKCKNLTIFDGTIMIVTSVVLTFLALNFYKMIYNREKQELKMRRRVDGTIAAAQAGGASGTTFAKKHAFLVFSFTTGLREGLESVIFLVGVISDFKDPSYISSLPIPMITALVLSRIVGCIFFQGTKRMRVDRFMRFCSFLLLIIAAGFFMSSTHKWQELGLFGTWSPLAERPWQNRRVWDASDCCNDKTNRFFVLMRALFGWQDQPTPMEFFAYVLYWVVAISIGAVLVRQAKRAIAKKVELLRQAQQREDAAEAIAPGGALKDDSPAEVLADTPAPS